MYDLVSAMASLFVERREYLDQLYL